MIRIHGIAKLARNGEVSDRAVPSALSANRVVTADHSIGYPDRVRVHVRVNGIAIRNIGQFERLTKELYYRFWGFSTQFFQNSPCQTFLHQGVAHHLRNAFEPMRCPQHSLDATSRSTLLRSLSGEDIQAFPRWRSSGVLGKSGKQLGEFGWIHEIACPSENELYVAEILNWRAQKLILEPTH